MTGSLLKVRVVGLESAATGIVSLEFAAEDGSQLPAFEPGAHIDVHLPNGLIRQYSLYNNYQPGGNYRIAVLLDEQGRGGSRAVHELVAVNDVLTIGKPRNHFPLVPAQRIVLMAGGIGITPILSMAQAMSALGQTFELHYCCRSQDRAAFHQFIKQSKFSGSCHFHFDDDPASALDAQTVLTSDNEDSRLFVCGPKGFMDFVIDTAAQLNWPKDRIHFEYFSGADVADVDGEGFWMHLARSDKRYFVGAEETALEVLLNNGHDIPVSCEQGICGTCATKVIAGEPDHKDMFLTDQERAANTLFTPCCSRALSSELVLDL